VCVAVVLQDRLLASLQARIGMVERFVQARQCAKSSPAEMVQISHQLLDTVRNFTSDRELDEILSRGERRAVSSCRCSG
jgi:hypothetical protein